MAGRGCRECRKQQGRYLAAGPYSSQGRVFSQSTFATAHPTSRETVSPAPRTMEKNSFHSPKHLRLDGGGGSAAAGGREGRILLRLSSLKEGKNTVTQGKQNHEESELERKGSMCTRRPEAECAGAQVCCECASTASFCTGAPCGEGELRMGMEVGRGGGYGVCGLSPG